MAYFIDICSYFKSLKKTLAILTLFLFAFNAGGYLFVFKIKQYQLKKEIKQQIKAGISEEVLTLITLDSETSSTIVWKDEHEFILKGQMYDVVRKGTDNKGNALLYCITDTQETLLFAELNNLANKKQSEKTKSAYKQIVNLIALETVLPDYKLTCCQEKREIRPRYRYIYSEPSLEIQIPPPKFV